MVDVFAARKLESMLRTKVEWRDFKRNTPSTANGSHFEEYLRFIALKAAFRDFDAKELSPSPEVDQIWHQHILFTKHYAEISDARSFITIRSALSTDGRSKNEEYSRQVSTSLSGKMHQRLNHVYLDKLRRRRRRRRQKNAKGLLRMLEIKEDLLSEGAQPVSPRKTKTKTMLKRRKRRQALFEAGRA